MKIQFLGSMPNYDRGADAELSAEEKVFAVACLGMGYEAASRGHSIVIADEQIWSADYHVYQGVLKFVREEPGRRAKIQVNRTEGSRLLFEDAPSNVQVEYRFSPNLGDLLHGTLIPNLAALESSDALVTLGGKLTVKLLGQIAADKEKPVVAFSSFGGTSTDVFQSLRFTYKQALKTKPFDSFFLQAPWRPDFAAKAIELTESLAATDAAEAPHSYFLSYNWDDLDKADHVEVLLHRARRAVNRDESMFKAGADLSDVVKSLITESDTFIALWNERYPKSNWCPQELAFAQSRKHQGLKPSRVVVLMMDDSEPPFQSFNALRYNAKEREHRENSLRKVIEQED